VYTKISGMDNRNPIRTVPTRLTPATVGRAAIVKPMEAMAVPDDILLRLSITESINETFLTSPVLSLTNI